MSSAAEQTIPDNLWVGATFAQTGKSFQKAIETALEFRPELDRDNIIDTAFLTGLGYLLTLADHQLASVRVRGFKRDLNGVTEKVRGELADLRQQFKEATVPLEEQQISTKLRELGIAEDATPSRMPLPVSDLKLCIHLRARRIDARFTQRREVTVPGSSYGEACDLMHAWERKPTDWIAEGRRLIGRGA